MNGRKEGKKEKKRNKVKIGLGSNREMKRESKCKRICPKKKVFEKQDHITSRKSKSGIQGREGQILEAEFTLKLLKSSGCNPDVVTYTAMLDANNATVFHIAINHMENEANSVAGTTMDGGCRNLSLK
ncbi:hypothetical protein RYX36_005482 [Vicia faba]